MTPERWQKIEGLFEVAVARSLEERGMFLDEACAGDDSLRREVEALLASDREEQGALEEIAYGMAAELMAERDGHELVGQTLGRYQILAPLGSGGMGEVYLAQDTTLDRKVALKLLPRQFTRDRDRLRRFEQEARAASALNHPNIITIYEVGEWDGARFIAAEYVEGETLGEQMRKPDRPLSLILDIGMQAAGALAAAHAAGIVHRDIKPANIMLRRDGFIKVLDFGLAKLTSARAHLDVTEPGRVMGTINYMSPEQAMGQPLDHRTDIFSLGVVLYEIASGQRLFEGKSEAAVYDAILHKPPPLLRDFIPTSPPQFDQVLRRALEKDPARRYQTAQEFRADLKCLLNTSGTTEAAHIATRERGLRRRSQALHWAAIVLALSAVFAGMLFLRGKFPPGSPNESSRKSIAVLPFANLSSDPENVYFAEGVQDQVLTDLAKIAQLKVIGRTSVMQYKAEAARDLRQIGQQLGASYLVEGTVQRAGGRVRVNTVLLEANGNGQLWAETYDRELADVFDIQSEIAKGIATQLQAKLSPAEAAALARKPTSDLRAFELYTRARTLLDIAGSSSENADQNARTAINLLDQATHRDASFLAAWCELARGHDFLFWTGIDHSATRLALAQAAVDATQKITPDSGEAHLTSAKHFYTQRDFDGAERELTAARTKLPNDSDAMALGGYIHRRLGHWQESTRALEQTVEVDPRNVVVLQDLAINYGVMKDYRRATAVLDRIIAIAPDRFVIRISRAEFQLACCADTKPLQQAIETALQQDPANAKSLVQNQLTLAFYQRDIDGIAKALNALGDRWYGNDTAKYPREFGEGMLARIKGDTVAAQAHFSAARTIQARIVESQPDYAPAISMLGLIDAALARKGEALREGHRAIELLPVEKDSLNGPAMLFNLAIIAAWVGENDLAIEQLHRATQLPASRSYGELKLDPMFDPLRSDPRFEEILTSLAPTGAK